MTRNAILVVLLLLSPACKGDAESKSSGDEAAGTTKAGTAAAEPSSVAKGAGGLFDESIREDPCALLTGEMVAKVAKVEADKVEQRKIRGMCLYEFQGGNAGIAFVKTYKSVEMANTRFTNGHKGMTGAEVKAAMDTIADGAKDKLATEADKGKKVPGDKAVEVVAGGVAKSMGGGIQFETVEGLGDKAAYDITRHETIIADTKIVSYANKIDVLLGNLGFSISYSLNAADHQGKMHKEEAVELSNLVLVGLK